MENNTRPDAAQEEVRDGVLEGTPAVYVYINLPNNRGLLKLIAGWLWKKKMENRKSADRKKEDSSKPLFEGVDVDLCIIMEDMERQGWKPCHIHLMKREHGGVRIRITWIKDALEHLSAEEMAWVRMMFARFVYAVKAYRSHGTTHLPPHIGIHIAYPTERDQATTVFSVQIFKGELSLINDPGTMQDLARDFLSLKL